MPSINIAVIRFANCLGFDELDFFRGAIIEIAELNDATLFHNHTENGYRYEYPRIQYKNLQGRTSLVGINEGASALLWLRPYLNRELHIGYKTIPFTVVSVDNIEAQIGVVDNTMCYKLKGWMPLNQENDILFHSTSDEGERFIILEDILVNNIVSFYHDLGYKPTKNIRCRIDWRGDIRKVQYKGVEMRTIDIVFHTNALLPQYIGIGKGSSLGHGIVEIR